VDESTHDPYGFKISTLRELDVIVRDHDKFGELVSTVELFHTRLEGQPCFYIDEWCDKEQSLTCHCTTSCLCLRAGALDDECGGVRPGCEWGLGCFIGYCRPWF
jgi:hypothetical protein